MRLIGFLPLLFFKCFGFSKLYFHGRPSLLSTDHKSNDDPTSDGSPGEHPVQNGQGFVFLAILIRQHGRIKRKNQDYGCGNPGWPYETMIMDWANTKPELK